jgi:type IV pilus assembly protein PilX
MNRHPLRRQRGTALIIAMLFLVILGMLGVTTMTATTLEERMAGNTRDRDLAMQAAEAALRDAERDLTNTAVTAGRVLTLANFVAACTAGLCTEGATILTNIDDPTKSAYFTQYMSSSQPFMGPAAQPRYIIELLTAMPPQVPAPPAGQQIRNFRITAKGFGRNTNTVVILQTVFQLTI